jgi:hypothetical protein
MSPAEETAQCPPRINLPDFHYACNSASDCAIAGDGCRSCDDPFVINKKFLKEFDERDQLLRQKYECSVACEACANDDAKIYCVNRKCTLKAPPETAGTASPKKAKKRALEARPAEAEDADSAALDREDRLEKDDMY